MLVLVCAYVCVCVSVCVCVCVCVSVCAEFAAVGVGVCVCVLGGLLVTPWFICSLSVVTCFFLLWPPRQLRRVLQSQLRALETQRSAHLVLVKISPTAQAAAGSSK